MIMIILSRGDSPGKTIYIEKNHPTLVISHLRCGEISPGWDESILIHKRFVFRKWNTPFCWYRTLVRYSTQVECLIS